MNESVSGRIVIDAINYLGETPVWSVAEQAFYWINCEEPPLLRRWNPATDEMQTWPMPERIGGLALRRSGSPVVCLGSGVFDFDPVTGALSLRAPRPYPPHVKLHESAIDPSGRLWIGGKDEQFGSDNPWPGGAAICRLEGDKLIAMIPGLSLTNSLAFSPDGKRMYFADSLRRLIWCADIDPATGGILGVREFIRLNNPQHVGDGAAVDVEGGYWLAVFGAGEVRRYLPDGTLDQTIKLPFSQPTKPAFGGADLRSVYVTSTQMNVPGFDMWGANGAIFEFRSPVEGVPEHLFAG